MKYLLLIYEAESLYENMDEAQRGEVFVAYDTYTKDLKNAGALVGGDALLPVATATTVRVRNGKVTNTDGPFAETKEQLGGYYLIDVPDLDAALGWAARLPAATSGSIEVRPLMVFEQGA